MTTHDAEAHRKADSIAFCADCPECWRERLYALIFRRQKP